MKYIAVIDDDMLTDIRELRIVVVSPKNGCQNVSVKPLLTHTVTLEDGQSLYLTQGHINAMMEYEKMAVIKRIIGDVIGENLE